MKCPCGKSILGGKIIKDISYCPECSKKVTGTLSKGVS